MKLVAIILVSCLCAIVYANGGNENSYDCFKELESQCTKLSNKESSKKIAEMCNAKLNEFDIKHVNEYVEKLLFKSYEYLYLATRFGAYQKNRFGFQKLYQELSDKHFDEAIDLIKHINKRGGSINMKNLIKNTANNATVNNLDKDELVSLGIALDTEKELFNKAVYTYNEAIHQKNHKRDPEFAHYFEEKFLGSQAETVRKLSGYLNDLFKIVKTDGDKELNLVKTEGEKQLGIYMFDEYLQKQ